MRAPFEEVRRGLHYAYHWRSAAPGLVARHLRILTSDGGLDAKMLEDKGPRLTPEGERVDALRRANPANRDCSPPAPEPEAIAAKWPGLIVNR